MSANYQLTLRGQQEPLVLDAIDAMLVYHYRTSDVSSQYDAEKWWHGWHNIIGFKLALGESFEEIRLGFLKQRDEHDARGEFMDALWDDFMADVAGYLGLNFTSNAWTSWGRS